MIGYFTIHSPPFAGPFRFDLLIRNHTLSLLSCVDCRFHIIHAILRGNFHMFHILKQKASSKVEERPVLQFAWNTWCTFKLFLHQVPINKRGADALSSTFCCRSLAPRSCRRVLFTDAVSANLLMNTELNTPVRFPPFRTVCN